jgi:hypothetical protein
MIHLEKFVRNDSDLIGLGGKLGKENGRGSGTDRGIQSFNGVEFDVLVEKGGHETGGRIHEKWRTF